MYKEDKQTVDVPPKTEVYVHRSDERVEEYMQYLMIRNLLSRSPYCTTAELCFIIGHTP